MKPHRQLAEPGTIMKQISSIRMSDLSSDFPSIVLKVAAADEAATVDAVE